jgi:hypothetical protein
MMRIEIKNGDMMRIENENGDMMRIEIMNWERAAPAAPIWASAKDYR